MPEIEKKLKKNVAVFNEDVLSNQGYQYTTNTSYSAIITNKRLTDLILQMLSELGNGGTVVDVGCGDGAYTNEIKKKLPMLELSAFDPAEKAIELAKSVYPQINFFTANLLDEYSLPEKKYDIAIIRGVLHHLDYPVLAIRNAAKIARQIIIIDPNGNNPILKLIEKKSAYHIKHEEKSYAEKEFKKFCEEAECEIVSISYVGFVPFFSRLFRQESSIFFSLFWKKYRF